LKVYLANLEKENEELRTKILQLTEENNNLTKQINYLKASNTKASSTISKSSAFTEVSKPNQSLYDQLKSAEKHKFVTLPKMWREDPSSVKYSMYEQSRDDVGPFGKIRIAFLKEQFNNIIENLIPMEQRIALCTFDNIQMHRLVKLNTGKLRK